MGQDYRHLVDCHCRSDVARRSCWLWLWSLVVATITTLEPIAKEVDDVLLDDFKPEERSKVFAEYANEQILENARLWLQLLGHVVDFIVYVDGKRDVPLTDVRADGGEIDVEFEVAEDVLRWIADQLEKHSPVGSGKDPHPGLYKKSHVLFADGKEVEDITKTPPAAEYDFVNIVPYARKIERGSSSQAPDGVYQAVAILAQQRFGGIADISFAYRTPEEGAIVPAPRGNRSEGRNPAIIVKL